MRFETTRLQTRAGFSDTSLQTEISFGEMFRDRKNVSKRKRVIAPDKFASNDDDDDDDDDDDGNNNNSVVDDDDDDDDDIKCIFVAGAEKNFCTSIQFIQLPRQKKITWLQN